MTLTFKKIKFSPTNSVSKKYPKLSSSIKTPSVKINKPKVVQGKSLKSFDFSKFTKKAKLPKEKKISILKRSIKKVKNKGY